MKEKRKNEKKASASQSTQMLKNMRLVILFDMLFNPSFKMTTSFANIARNTASIFINLPNLPDKMISVHASY